MKKWSVQLGEQQSEIYFDVDLSTSWAQVLPDLRGRKVLVLTDDNVAAHYLAAVQTALTPLAAQVVPVVLPAGEASKRLSTVTQVYQQLITAQFSRRDYLLALGGGVIGDLGGLIASTYMRGLHLLQVPTTIVAQADSSLGGKTAVDYDGYKNLIGTFYPAERILIDPRLLRTLPAREISCGMAEILKALLVSPRQPAAYQLLTSSKLVTGVLPLELPTFIEQALLVKRQFVEQDFYDFRERRFLNFGHTIGHSVEALAQGRLQHGEAVSIGLVTIMTALVAHQQLAASVLTATRRQLEALALPVTIPADLSHAAIIKQLYLDKKAADGQIELVLLHGPGQAYLQKMAIPAFQAWLGWS